MPSQTGQAPTYGDLALLHRVTTQRPSLTLARTSQPAGCVAGHHIALHAEPAHVDTLVELFRIVAAVMLRDAAALLGGVLDFLRTGRQAQGKQHQSDQASQSHDARASVRALAFALTSSRPGREPMKRECQMPNSTGI